MKNKAIVLVQMGGPLSKAEMKDFLWRMFTDSHILPFPLVFRYALAAIITNVRYKKSWSKYMLIGGTPIIQHTNDTAKELSMQLGGFRVETAFSYSPPYIPQKIKELKKQGVTEIFILPLYPHYSITTFQSVIDYSVAAASKNGLKALYSPCYYDNNQFIQHWVELIQQELDKHNIKDAHLVFSGHSIPMSFIKKGDTYGQQIAISAQLISQKLGLKHSVSFQSQLKGQKWLGPETDKIMVQLKKDGIDNLVLVPISFVNENLETLYDMDMVLVPYGEKELGFNKVMRAKLPPFSPVYIEQLKILSTKFVFADVEEKINTIAQ
jgi:ferrochelatase